MDNLTSREWTTAIVSALVAIAILGLGVTAQSPPRAPIDRIASLELDLRYQLDLMWRHDRGALEARVSELDSVLEAWRRSPQSAGDRKLITAWLRDSIVQSLPGESGQLPAAPTFSVLPPAAPVATQPVPPAAQPADAATRSTPPTPSVGRPQQAPPVVNARPPAPAATAPHMAKRPSSSPTEARPGPGGLRVIARSPVVPIPPLDPRTAQAPPVVQQRPAASAPTPAARRQPVEVAAAEPIVDPPTMSPYGRPDASPPTPPQRPAPKLVQLNLAELNARIAGYHGGLDEVQATVVAARKRLTIGQITRLVEQLEQLAGQYRFVRLYYDSLDDKEQLFVIQPRDMSDVIKLVDLQRTQVAGTDDEDFLTSLAADAEEDELARRLQAIAKAVNKKPPAPAKEVP